MSFYISQKEITDYFTKQGSPFSDHYQTNKPFIETSTLKIDEISHYNLTSDRFKNPLYIKAYEFFWKQKPNLSGYHPIESNRIDRIDKAAKNAVVILKIPLLIKQINSAVFALYHDPEVRAQMSCQSIDKFNRCREIAIYRFFEDRTVQALVDNPIALGELIMDNGLTCPSRLSNEELLKRWAKVKQRLIDHYSERKHIDPPALDMEKVHIPEKRIKQKKPIKRSCYPRVIKLLAAMPIRCIYGIWNISGEIAYNCVSGKTKIDKKPLENTVITNSSPLGSKIYKGNRAREKLRHQINMMVSGNEKLIDCISRFFPPSIERLECFPQVDGSIRFTLILQNSEITKLGKVSPGGWSRAEGAILNISKVIQGAFLFGEETSIEFYNPKNTKSISDYSLIASKYLIKAALLGLKIKAAPIFVNERKGVKKYQLVDQIHLRAFLSMRGQKVVVWNLEEFIHTFQNLAWKVS